MAGGQLVQLEAQKKLAIENEDFDTAKVLKFEIERLRSMAMTLDTDRVILAPLHQSFNRSIGPNTVTMHPEGVELDQRMIEEQD